MGGVQVNAVMFHVERRHGSQVICFIRFTGSQVLRFTGAWFMGSQLTWVQVHKRTA